MSTSTRRRIENLEAQYVPPASTRPIRRFLVDPKPGVDPVEALRAAGHDVRDGDIVRIIVRAPQRDTSGAIILPFPETDQ